MPLGRALCEHKLSPLKGERSRSAVLGPKEAARRRRPGSQVTPLARGTLSSPALSADPCVQPGPAGDHCCCEGSSSALGASALPSV